MKPEVREYQQAPVEIDASQLAPPIVTWVGPGNVWRLDQAYSYRDGATTITVPEGYEFDLASIPRALWSLISPFELSISAPLVHDYLYQHKGAPPGAIEPPRAYSRKEADQLFRHMMELEGVPRWRRALAYAGVRVFGRFGWRES